METFLFHQLEKFTWAAVANTDVTNLKTPEIKILVDDPVSNPSLKNFSPAFAETIVA